MLAILDAVERFIYGFAHSLACLAHDDDFWDDEESFGVPSIAWPSAPEPEFAPMPLAVRSA